MIGHVRYDFSGAVVLVTGGARGQGLSHALRFLDAGATVYVFDLGAESLPGVPYTLSGERQMEFALQQMRLVSTKCSVWPVDVSVESSVKDSVERIIDEVGRIDVLVNNAGVNAIDSVENLSLEAWHTVLNVNLLGTFLCSKHVSGYMRSAGDGRIVCIASMAGVLGVPSQAHYTASKAGVLGLTKSLAVELGRYNIRVNAICPSVVQSPQTVGLSSVNPIMPMQRGLTPYALPGLTALTPNEVSEAVLWLASDASRYVTGTSITVDAGLSIRR